MRLDSRTLAFEYRSLKLLQYIAYNLNEHMCDKTCIKLIVVRRVLEPTVRQSLLFFFTNAHSIYYCILKVCINTSNHNQFDTCFVIRAFSFIVSDDKCTAKVLSTFNHLSPMTERSTKM